jgi:hypothetical protein
MIRVRNKDSIDCPGKLRIVRLSENRANVSLTLDEAANPQKCERQAADIDGVDCAAGTHRRREFEREVSGTAAQINDRAALLEIESAYYFRGTLPLIPLSLDDVETSQRVQCLITSVKNEKKNYRAQRKDGQFDAVAHFTRRLRRNRGTDTGSSWRCR